MSLSNSWLATGALLISLGLFGGLSRPAFPASEPAALPDAATMLREVEAHQKQLDKMRENYTFRSVQTVRQLDSKGNTKKTETEEHEVFFANGHRVESWFAKMAKTFLRTRRARNRTGSTKKSSRSRSRGTAILIR